MTSLWHKLKGLVNASVRGPRQYKTKPDPPDETAREEPEVTEASARRRKLPEVTEAPPTKVERSVRPAAAPTSRPITRVEVPEITEQQTDTLEESRVADLLTEEQS